MASSMGLKRLKALDMGALAGPWSQLASSAVFM
jgi:hypothetical protein